MMSKKRKNIPTANDFIKRMSECIEYKNLVNMLYACQKTIYQQEHYETKRNNLAQNKISLGDVEYKKQVLALNREEFNAKTIHPK